jgi:hypothetical protein
MANTVAGDELSANPESHRLWMACATVDKYLITS